MSNYTYRIMREVWIDVEIEAEDEEAAQAEYEHMEDSGELNYIFRDEVLEAESTVAEIWDSGVEDGKCIYSIY